MVTSVRQWPKLVTFWTALAFVDCHCVKTKFIRFFRQESKYSGLPASCVAQHKVTSHCNYTHWLKRAAVVQSLQSEVEQTCNVDGLLSSTGNTAVSTVHCRELHQCLPLEGHHHDITGGEQTEEHEHRQFERTSLCASQRCLSVVFTFPHASLKYTEEEDWSLAAIKPHFQSLEWRPCKWSNLVRENTLVLVMRLKRVEVVPFMHLCVTASLSAWSQFEMTNGLRLYFKSFCTFSHNFLSFSSKVPKKHLFWPTYSSLFC